VNQDGCNSLVGVAKLLVGASLTHLDETQCFEPSGHLPRLEHGNVAHLRDLDRLGADEIAFQRWLPILQEHGHDLGEAT
jgi:hypothetical protein